MFGYSTVDQVSDMPEVADFVPELVCLGIDVAICGVISQVPHLIFHTRKCIQMRLSNMTTVCAFLKEGTFNPMMIMPARLCTLH